MGSDVKSLFPSLKNIETARLARCAVLQSEIKFDNWDFQKALRYIFINGGREYISKSGLLRHCPKWKGGRVDLLAVGGDKSKDSNNWVDSWKEIFESEKKRIVAAVVEISVNVVMSTHVYTFCGNYYLQVDGGPIGLRSTASLAPLIMNCGMSIG